MKISDLKNRGGEQIRKKIESISTWRHLNTDTAALADELKKWLNMIFFP